jgi:hypothetical protein
MITFLLTSVSSLPPILLEKLYWKTDHFCKIKKWIRQFAQTIYSSTKKQQNFQHQNPTLTGKIPRQLEILEIRLHFDQCQNGELFRRSKMEFK